MKRVWMLLLTLIALLIVLAVPAMASEIHVCNGQHPESEGWKKLDGKSAGDLADGGKYYIEGDTYAKYCVFGKENCEITICLNGHTWQGDSDTKRAFAINKSTTLNIFDRKDENGNWLGRIIGGNIATGDLARASSGGCISVYANAQLNIYGGTIVGGTAYRGGAIYMEDATVRFYDGRIVGGNATCQGTTQNSGLGGNICLNNTSAQFNMYGGQIVGGKTDVFNNTVTNRAKGAVIYVGAGKFDATVAAPEGMTLSDKRITAAQDTESQNTESENGGLITIRGTNAYFKAKDVEFEGGKSDNAGGAFRVETAKEMRLESCDIVSGYGCSGAALYSATSNCEVTLTDVNISATQGKAYGEYGLIYMFKSNGKIVINGGELDARNVVCTLGGTAIYVRNGKVEVKDSYTRMNGESVTNDGTEIWGGSSPRGVAVFGTEDCQEVTIEGAVIHPGTANTEQTGGSAVGISKGSFTLRNTTILEGTTSSKIANGGVIHMDNQAQLVIDGGTIYGGTASGKGGAIYMENTASSLTIKGGAEIIGGTAPLGGAICINSGTFTLENGTISGGTATEAGDNLYAPSKHAKIALLGGSVDGGVYMADANTNYEFPKLTLGGEIQICNTEKPNIYLGYRAASADKAAAWATIQIEGLKNTARIGITLQEEAVSKRVITTAGAADIATAQTWQSCIYSDNTAYSVGIVANNGLFITSGATGATLNGGNVYYELPAALAAAGLTLTETAPAGIVTMLEDYTGNVTVPNGAWLDINGKTLTGNVDVQSGALYLLDSTTNDYNVADENGNLVYGKVIGNITSTDSLVTSFTTQNQNGYTGNHRYIVLVDKDKDGNMTYHAHRIYLALKSVVLYPQGPHLQYRTNFKCDQVVAAAAKYGVQISGVPYGKTEAESAVAYYASKVEGMGVNNERIAGLTNILDGLDKNDANYLERRNHLATMEYTAHGYIEVNGQKFYSNSKAVTSFKAMVETVDDMWTKGDTGVNDVVKAALVGMYQNYSDLMSGWDITEIKAAADAASKKSK